MPIARGGRRDRAYRAILAPDENRPALGLRTLAGQDAVYGAAGMVPDYDWTQMGVPARLTVGRATLARLAVLSYEEVQPASPLGTLRGQDAVYGPAGMAADYDWTQQGVPASTYARRARQTLAGLVYEDVQSANPLGTLAGQGQMYGPPGMAPDYDWPMAVRRPPAADWADQWASGQALRSAGSGAVVVKQLSLLGVG